MTMTTYIRKGENNVDCPVCGFKKKSGEMVRRWDGVYVCREDWEVRHPQDLLRITEENSSVLFSYGDDDYDKTPVTPFVPPSP